MSGTLLAIVITLGGAYAIALWADAREGLDDLSFAQIAGMIAITTLAGAAGLRAWILDVRWGVAIGAAVILIAWALVLGLLSAPRRR